MYYINENIKDLYRVKFHDNREGVLRLDMNCLLYTSPSPRDAHESRMPSSA